MVEWLLKGEPYPVQQHTLDRAHRKQGFAFFLEQGLGKCALTLNEQLDAARHRAVDGFLIICPSALRFNWQQQARDWGYPFQLDAWPDVKPDSYGVIIHPEALISSGGEWVERWMKRRQIYCALDESSVFKNPQSRRTRWVLGHRDRLKMKRVLSGTWATEGIHEAWAPLSFVGAPVGKYTSFKAQYCQFGGWQGKKVTGFQESNVEALGEWLPRFAVIARKSEWAADLPEKLYCIKHFQMTSEQSRVYEEMARTYVAKLDGGDFSTAPQAISAMLRLSQISSGFTKNEEGVIRTLVPYEQNPKLRLLRDVLADIGTKVIVFHRFTYSGDLIAQMLMDTRTVAARLQGGMTKQEAEDAVNWFNESDAKVLLCQTHVGKYGLTLLGDQRRDPCHHVVFYENDWSAEARAQAEDRVHRYGQRYDVSYIDFAGSAIERRVLGALTRKEKLFSAIIEAVRRRGEF